MADKEEKNSRRYSNWRFEERSWTHGKEWAEGNESYINIQTWKNVLSFCNRKAIKEIMKNCGSSWFFLWIKPSLKISLLLSHASKYGQVRWKLQHLTAYYCFYDAIRSNDMLLKTANSNDCCDKNGVPLVNLVAWTSSYGSS